MRFVIEARPWWCVSSSFQLVVNRRLIRRVATSDFQPHIFNLAQKTLQTPRPNLFCSPRHILLSTECCGFSCTRCLGSCHSQLGVGDTMLGRACKPTEARLWDDMDPRGRLLAERHCQNFLYYTCRSSIIKVWFLLSLILLSCSVLFLRDDV